MLLKENDPVSAHTFTDYVLCDKHHQRRGRGRGSEQTNPCPGEAPCAIYLKTLRGVFVAFTTA